MQIIKQAFTENSGTLSLLFSLFLSLLSLSVFLVILDSCLLQSQPQFNFLQVPSKGRNFLWRAVKNAIPVKTSLVRRQVLTEATCEQCKLQPKSVVHALWSCPCLKEVWDSDHSWSFRSTRTFSDFEQLVLHIIDAGLDLDVFSMVVWSLWYRRNQVRVGNSVPPIDQTLVQVQKQLQDYYQAQPVKSTPLNPTHHSATCWTPPSAPTLKINYDGAVLFHRLVLFKIF